MIYNSIRVNKIGNKTNQIICRLIENTDGVTAIEYGLIAALIAVAAIVAFQAVGTSLSDVFNEVATSL
jgi:pilus assembly protein Flp/PilA